MTSEPPPTAGPGAVGPWVRSLRTRSSRYHRPRAPFCGVGYCTNCLVRVDGVPNVRACRTLIPPGAHVEVENGWPSARFDLLAAFDLVFPNGIDTLRGFRRPGFATPWYQRVVRRLAGTGRFPTPERPVRSTPGTRVETETAIVGAGIAGTRCAARLVGAGETPTVLERDGSSPSIEGVALLPRTTAVFLPPPREGAGRRFELIGSRSDGSAVAVRANRVVVAVGGYDASLWFAGNDRPGVFTAEGAERLCPKGPGGFSRALVFGGGVRALQILEKFAGQVDAVVAPGPIAPELSRRASEHDVPLYPRTQILGVVGRRRVRGVRLAPRGAGSPPFDLEADALVLAHRRLPHPQLFFQAGARMRWRPDVGAYGPVLGPSGETTVPGLYAAGEVAGSTDEESAIRSAEAVAAALRIPGEWIAPVAAGPSDARHELEGYYQELLERGTGPGKVVACPCEDVLLSEVLEASERGYRGIEVVKRYTGLGTGLCQGRYCLPEALLVLGPRERRPVAEVGYITQRPPVVPTPLGALAGLPEPAEGAP